MTNLTIRKAAVDDITQIMQLAEAVKLFTPEEFEFMQGMLEEYFESSGEDGSRWIVAGEDQVTGAAYYAPESFGPGVWNILFLGVLPAQQGQGIGSQLLRYVEQGLKNDSARKILVETSGKLEFVNTRNFYIKNNYTLEATITDYYGKEDDKLTFTKAL